MHKTLKLNARLSFYYCYVVAEMAWNKPCGFNTLNTVFRVVWIYSLAKIEDQFLTQIWKQYYERKKTVNKVFKKIHFCTKMY